MWSYKNDKFTINCIQTKVIKSTMNYENKKVVNSQIYVMLLKNRKSNKEHPKGREWVNEWFKNLKQYL